MHGGDCFISHQFVLPSEQWGGKGMQPGLVSGKIQPKFPVQPG